MTHAAAEKIVLFRQTVESESKFRSQVPVLAGTVSLRFIPSSANSISNSKHWRALPNPSLKRTPNSIAFWPSSAGPAAHFAPAAQRATPLAPA
jgi:hypothetical protein